MESKKEKPKNYNFSKLDAKDFESGALLGLENAENLLCSARLCFDNGFHSSSSNLMITSLEELVKALYLLLRSHDPKAIKIKDFDKLFYNHDEKHYKVLLGFFSMHLDHKANSFTQNVSFLIMAIVLGLAFNGIQEIEGNGNKNLEFLRKQSLYLDLDKETLKWVAPQNFVKPEMVEASLKLVEQFFDHIKTTYFMNENKVSIEKLIQRLLDEKVKFQKRK